MAVNLQGQGGIGIGAQLAVGTPAFWSLVILIVLLVAIVSLGGALL